MTEPSRPTMLMGYAAAAILIGCTGAILIAVTIWAVGAIV